MVQIVIVVYKKDLNECLTLNLLKQILNENKLNEVVDILVYDNSPVVTKLLDKSSLNIEVVNDTSNSGISKAYNVALSKAEKNGHKWLMLFDQDTSVTAQSFMSQFNAIAQIGDKKIVAIVPKIIGQNGKMISPMKVDDKLNMYDLCDNKSVQKDITALNSSTMVNVEFLKSIGGFSTTYKLDMLDHWLFFQIRKKNCNVYVVNEIIQHELSVLDYNNMNEQRYINILTSEKCFYEEALGKKGLKIYKKHLFLRMLKHLVLTKNKNYYKITRKALKGDID